MTFVANRKTLLALHLQEVGARLDRFVAGGLLRAAGRDTGVGAPQPSEPEHERAEAARSVGPLEHDRAGAVAEQDAGAAIPPVDDPRHHVRADHQHVLQRARLHELGAGDQPVAERRAARPDVERAGPGRPERLLDQRAGGRESRDDRACRSPRRSGRGRRGRRRPSPGRPARRRRPSCRTSRRAPRSAARRCRSACESTHPTCRRVVSISWLSMIRAGRYLPSPAIRTLAPLTVAPARRRLGGVLDRHQCLSGVDELARLGQDRGDPPASLGENLVEDLHRLDQADHGAGLRRGRQRSTNGGAPGDGGPVEDAGQRRHQRRAVNGVAQRRHRAASRSGDHGGAARPPHQPQPEAVARPPQPRWRRWR